MARTVTRNVLALVAVVVGVIGFGAGEASATPNCNYNWERLTRDHAGVCTNRDIVEVWAGGIRSVHIGGDDVVSAEGSIPPGESLAFVDFSRQGGDYSVLAYAQLALVAAGQDSDSSWALVGGVGGLVSAQSSPSGNQYCGITIAGGACQVNTAGGCTVLVITPLGLVQEPCPPGTALPDPRLPL